MSKTRATCVALTCAAVALAATAVFAGFAGTDVYLPSVGRGTGSAGAEWYTTMWIYNPNAAPVNVQIYFLERAHANPVPLIYNDTIPAGDVRRYPSTITTLFGIEGYGALRVVATAPVVVNGRIYNKPDAVTEKDSTGQFFAGVPAGFAIGNGERTQLLAVYQTKPDNDSEYRYSFGWVEVGGAIANIRITVLDETGATVAAKDYSQGARGVAQFNFKMEFPVVNTQNARLQAEVTSGTGKVVFFGSLIANHSSDPSTVEMVYADTLLDAGDLTLPWAGSTTSTGRAFEVTNDGVGTAIVGQSTAGTGVHGKSSGAKIGVLGESATGFGVKGLTASTSVGTAAVYGDSSNKAMGVWGRSTTGIGVGGGSNNTFGVYGESDKAAGVRGAAVTSAAGVSGLTYNTGSSGTVIDGWRGLTTRVFRVDGNGKGFFNGGTQTGGADVAEFIDSDVSLGPGDVVEIDPSRPQAFRLSTTASSTAVAGVVSSDPGMTMNAQNAAGWETQCGPQLALVGRVPVKASAENGAITPGDLLVASSTPGHAMRAPANPAAGTVIGKALGTLESGVGTVEMLVMLR